MIGQPDSVDLRESQEDKPISDAGLASITHHRRALTAIQVGNRLPARTRRATHMLATLIASYKNVISGEAANEDKAAEWY